MPLYGGSRKNVSNLYDSVGMLNTEHYIAMETPETTET